MPGTVQGRGSSPRLRRCRRRVRRCSCCPRPSWARRVTGCAKPSPPTSSRSSAPPWPGGADRRRGLPSAGSATVGRRAMGSIVRGARCSAVDVFRAIVDRQPGVGRRRARALHRVRARDVAVLPRVAGPRRWGSDRAAAAGGPGGRDLRGMVPVVPAGARRRAARHLPERRGDRDGAALQRRDRAAAPVSRFGAGPPFAGARVRRRARCWRRCWRVSELRARRLRDCRSGRRDVPVDLHGGRARARWRGERAANGRRIRRSCGRRGCRAKTST